MRYILEDEKEKLKNEILLKAKFQKVMLLYDNSTANSQIEDLKNMIKTDCVFNSQNIEYFNELEIFNGYKLIIYMCEIDSFLKLNFDRSEFSNIYFSKGEILPFFINENHNENLDDLIVLKKNHIDDFAIKSITTNKFFNYISNLLIKQKSEINFYGARKDITQFNIFLALNNFEENLLFIDLKILKDNNLPYKFLPILDVMIINAFSCLFQTVREKKIALVDVYKVAKDDDMLIDKFYAMSHDRAFLDLINLNYANIVSILNSTKLSLVENLATDVSQDDINQIFYALKNSSKNDTGILCYLYLFNIFNE